MSKSLLDLPSAVVFRGSKLEVGLDGKASLHARVDRAGTFVIPIWDCRDLAIHAQPDVSNEFNDLSITELLAGIIPTGAQRIYLYLNPIASQMRFDREEFNLSQLESDKLILLPNEFESSLSIYASVSQKHGTELDARFVRDVRCAAPTLPGWKLFRVMQKIEHRWRRQKELKQSPPKPKWTGQMRCNHCHYLWTSRRSTPPASCPKCRSRSIRKSF